MTPVVTGSIPLRAQVSRTPTDYSRRRPNLLKIYKRTKSILKCGDYQLNLGGRVRIMGVLNLTPDSFSGDGLYGDIGAAVERANRLQDEGADVIDIGAESSRPGAKEVPVEEELGRILPVLKKLCRKVKIPISVDTYKFEVAQRALDAGASIINDITGLNYAPAIARLAAGYNAGLVLMHMKGNPRTMQKNPRYNALIPEIIKYLKNSMRVAYEAGVKAQQITVDPGIGFGKTLRHNLEILRNLTAFKVLGRPLLVGPSRKSFIGGILDLPVTERLEGTLASLVVCALNGADILRVHDVKAAKRALEVTEAIINGRIVKYR